MRATLAGVRFRAQNMMVRVDDFVRIACRTFTGGRPRTPVCPEVTIEPEIETSPRSAESVAAALTQVAIDQKAFDAVIMDMRSLVDYTDLFVLCTARNRRHVAALADVLRQHAKRDLHLLAQGVEGLPSARWVLLDFGNVVVHVFDEPMRGFYNLDGLWSDAPRLPVPESAPADPASGADADDLDDLDDQQDQDEDEDDALIGEGDLDDTDRAEEEDEFESPSELGVGR